MRVDWTISAIGHAGVLLYALVSIAASPLNKPPTDSLPVDIISSTDFSQLTKGIEDRAEGRGAEAAGGEGRRDQADARIRPNKVVDKPEVAAAADEPPKPQPPKPEAKPAPAPPVPQARPEPKQAFAKEEQKIDPIAEAIKRDQKKQEQKQKQAAQQPPKQPEPQKQQPKFDASQIQQRLALLDKRDPQRRAATGRHALARRRRSAPPTGTAAALSQNEIDALRARLRDCWTVPAGLADARDLVVTVRIQFNKDGSLAADPRLMNQGSHPAFQAASESALRAVRRCAPYTFMPPAKYEGWKDIIVDFDPRDMFRG